MTEAPLVALLTDFGDRDAYAGVLRAVVLGLAPRARVVDLTHGIPPGDVLAGALQLEAAWPYLPAGSAVAAVVDPGVGGPRRAVALAAGGRFFAGPDNGLAHFLLVRAAVEAAVELVEPRLRLAAPSATFHGRDVFAPAAAHLAAGVPLREFGPALRPEELARLELPEPEEIEGGLRAHVLDFDRFGNALLDLTVADFERAARGRPARAETARGPAPLRATFAEVAPGRPCLYRGSGGRMELACRDGSAAEMLGLARFAGVEILWGET